MTRVPVKVVIEKENAEQEQPITDTGRRGSTPIHEQDQEKITQLIERRGAWKQ